MQEIWRSIAVLGALVLALFVGFTLARSFLLPGAPRPTFRAEATPTPVVSLSAEPTTTAGATDEEPEPTDEEPTDVPPTDLPASPSPSPTSTSLFPTLVIPSGSPATPGPTVGPNGEVVREFPDLILDADLPGARKLTFQFRTEGAQRVRAAVAGGGPVEVCLFVGPPPAPEGTRCFDLTTSAVRARVSRDADWTLTLIGADQATTTDLTLSFISDSAEVTQGETPNVANE